MSTQAQAAAAVPKVGQKRKASDPAEIVTVLRSLGKKLRAAVEKYGEDPDVCDRFVAALEPHERDSEVLRTRHLNLLAGSMKHLPEEEGSELVADFLTLHWKYVTKGKTRNTRESWIQTYKTAREKVLRPDMNAALGLVKLSKNVHVY